MPARTPYVTAALITASVLVCAQPVKQFEVISIKPTTDLPQDQGGVRVRTSGSQVRISYMSIKDYVAMAYGVPSQQVFGPDWIGQQRFDLSAKLPDGSAAGDVPAMMQAMLATQFEMAMHRESREFPVYALTVARSGLRLKEVTGPDAPELPGTRNVDAGGSANGVAIDLGGGASFTLVPNHLDIRKVSMDTLARTLTRFSDRPVIDGTTGVPGVYDMTLELSPEEYNATLLRTAVNAGVTLPPQALRMLDGAASNPLTGALEKFGLSLESRRAPLDVVVVDSVRKTPLDN